MLENQKVLIIEDDLAMHSFLKILCETHAMNVMGVKTVAEAIKQFSLHKFDICLLDLGLPDAEGHDFIRTVRTWSQTPILVISARNDDEDKIKALDAGADDYILKPFSAAELLARIRVALRRHVPQEKLMEFGHLQVKPEQRLVINTDTMCDIHLTPIEYRLLLLFLNHANKVLTHSQIMQDIWGARYSGNTERIRVHIAQLRQKIERDPAHPCLILNEPGVGYRLRWRE